MPGLRPGLALACAMGATLGAALLVGGLRWLVAPAGRMLARVAWRMLAG